MLYMRCQIPEVVYATCCNKMNLNQVALELSDAIAVDVTFGGEPVEDESLTYADLGAQDHARFSIQVPKYSWLLYMLPICLAVGQEPEQEQEHCRMLGQVNGRADFALNRLLYFDESGCLALHTHQ